MPLRALYPLLAAIAFALACGDKTIKPAPPPTAEAAAARLCTLAQKVLDDEAIPDPDKPSHWLHLASAEIQQHAIHDVLRVTLQSGSESIEEPFFAMMKDALGKEWQCPAAETLLP